MIFYQTIIQLLHPYEINSDLIVCEEAGFSGVSTSLTTVPSVWGEQSIVTGAGEGKGTSIQRHTYVQLFCRCPLLEPVVDSPFLSNNDKYSILNLNKIYL